MNFEANIMDQNEHSTYGFWSAFFFGPFPLKPAAEIES